HGERAAGCAAPPRGATTRADRGLPARRLRRGRQRQLLLARRPLVTGHATHRAYARRLRRGPAVASGLRSSNGGGPGRRGRARDSRPYRGRGLSSMTPAGTASAPAQDPALSLYHLLDPEVLANPYPLYHRLRTEDPVHWDPYLHAWIVTRYADVVQVLHRFVADRTPTPAQLDAIGLSELGPVAQVMVRQMLFMDAPAHTRIRGLAAHAFTPRRVVVLRSHIQEIMDG